MNRRACGRKLGSMLTLGVLLLAVLGVALASAQVGPAQPGVQQDILQLARQAKGEPIPNAKLEDVKKKFGLDEVMESFKGRAKGGIGVGPMAKADGIEAKIIALGKKPLTDAQLKKEANDLSELGHLNAAIAQLTMLYPAPKPVIPGKGPNDWKEYAEQMAKSSVELSKAVKAGNPKEIQKVANNLNNACNSCHAAFRD